MSHGGRSTEARELNWPERLKQWIDRVQAVLIGAILTGSTLAFGGAVWWFRPVLALATGLLLLSWIVRLAIEGRVTIWKSPLSAIGLLSLFLGLAQLVPLPEEVHRRISPKGAEMIAAAEPEGLGPATALDGPIGNSSLAWWGGRGADRILRLGILRRPGGPAQVGLGERAFGIRALHRIGNCPVDRWPGRPLRRNRAGAGTDLGAHDGRGTEGARSDSAKTDGGLGGWLGGGPARASIRDRIHAGRSWGIFSPGLSGVASGARLGAPGTVPEGESRTADDPASRSGGRAKVAVLLVVVLLGSGLVGTLGGPILAVPVAIGLGLSGLSGLRVWGLRTASVVVTTLTLMSLGIGLWVGPMLDPIPGRAPISVGGWKAAEPDWKAAARVALDFPILGSGLGSYPTLVPHYKSADETPTTARSSLAQWWAEAGFAGLSLVGLGILWCLWKLPGSLRRIEPADYVLPASLMGAMASFALFSTIHWSMELSAVALSACAVAGTANRWLSGGTDLFVERA